MGEYYGQKVHFYCCETLPLLSLNLLLTLPAA